MVQELIQQAYAKVAEAGGVLDEQLAVELAGWFYSEAEKQVHEFREAQNASESTGGKKAKRAAFQPTPEQVKTVDEAMVSIRQTVFDAINSDPDVSILLWEELNDYTRLSLKLFRDFQLDFVEVEESDEVADDEELPEINVEEIQTLRQQAENFFNMAQKPAVKKAKDENGKDVPFTIHTKTRKSGENSLAWSNLRGINSQDSSAEETKKTGEVTTYKLRYEIDGELTPASTTLTQLGLWYFSSPDWTVDVEDIKRAVTKAYSVDKYSEVPNEFYVENLNGHTLRRYREKKN